MMDVPVLITLGIWFGFILGIGVGILVRGVIR